MNNFKDLEMKSFCVIKNFLDNNTISTILEDYFLIQNEEILYPKFSIIPAGKKKNLDFLKDTINPLIKNISDYSLIKTNYVANPVYFSIKHGINFPFHQDHDSWFLYGDHSNYLNVWIPIIKPNYDITNLSIINLYKLLNDHPELQFLENYGATEFTTGNQSKIIDYNNDKTIELDFDLNLYAETPHLNAGDALVMRGYAIHKTQDILTDRLAISFRCVNTNTKLFKENFISASGHKKIFFDTAPAGFLDKIKLHFETVNECTIGDIL